MTTGNCIEKNKEWKLPVEILFQILDDFCNFSSRCALTGALVHPTFTRGALKQLHSNGITALVEKPSTLNNLIRQLASQRTPLMVETLRIRPHNHSSIQPETIFEQILNHLVDVDYDIENLQISVPFQTKYLTLEGEKLFLLSKVKQLTILNRSWTSHICGALALEQVTLVQPDSETITSLMGLTRLKVVNIVFIADDECGIEDSYHCLLRNYAHYNRGGDCYNGLWTIDQSTADRINFIIMNGDPQSHCSMIKVGAWNGVGRVRHSFYRYSYSTGMDEFQRLDWASRLIKCMDDRNITTSLHVTKNSSAARYWCPLTESTHCVKV